MEPEKKSTEDEKSTMDIKSIDGFGPAEKPKPIESHQSFGEKKSFDEFDKPKTKKNSSKLLKVLLIILLVLVISGSAAAATYWWRDKTAIEQNNKKADEITALEKDLVSLKKQLAAAKASTDKTIGVPNETTCTVVAPTATVIENIKLSITSGNTAALSGYMAPSVNVIIAATEGVGLSTPAIAVSTVSTFITSTITSWDYNFALPAATLSGYSSGGYKEYFPSTAVVGKATNGKVISFSFDCDGKINTVFMAINGELL